MVSRSPKAGSECECCTRYITMYDPACLQCGGRYLRAIRALELPTEERQARMRKALADWMAHGHAEADLRALARKG